MLEGLAASQTKWKVLAQQVFFAHRNFGFKPDEEIYNMDAWDGYPATRQHIVDLLAEKDIQNTVVLTGDVHNSWANEVKTSVKDPNGKNVAVEFVGTSITSGGDGTDINKDTAQILQENQHIKFFNNQRGYVRCKVTQQTWQVDYQFVPYVTRPGAPISTRASFVVEEGKSNLKQLIGTPV